MRDGGWLDGCPILRAWKVDQVAVTRCRRCGRGVTVWHVAPLCGRCLSFEIWYLRVKNGTAAPQAPRAVPGQQHDPDTMRDAVADALVLIRLAHLEDEHTGALLLLATYSDPAEREQLYAGAVAHAVSLLRLAAAAAGKDPDAILGIIGRQLRLAE